MLVALVTVLSLAIPIESLTAPPGARYLLNDAGRIAKKSDGHWGFFYCGHPDCTPLKVTKSLTGHYPYGPSETAAGEARLLESCFPVCMRKVDCAHKSLYCVIDTKLNVTSCMYINSILQLERGVMTTRWALMPPVTIVLMHLK